MPCPPTLDDARRVLRDVFGYPEFRPAQRDVVASVLAGRNTLAVLPTGGGKSLCYQVPALVTGGLTLVVSPLISLMQDQVDRLQALRVPAAFVNSSLDPALAARELARAVSGELRLLYVAPERLDAPAFIAAMRRARVTLIAVDEAHCISEWGHEFRPSFRRIGLVRQSLGNPPVVALTATATPPVRADILRQLGIVGASVHVAGFDRENLSFAVGPCTGSDAKTRALTGLLRVHQTPAIIYAATRGSVEIVARRLGQARIRAVAYHAGLADHRRRAAQDAFMRGDVPVIVATNAFGMGIDKPDVRFVAHFAMPGTLEAYYQEAGRAGRDGKPSHCVLLYDRSDRGTYEHFLAQAHPPRAVVERVYAAICEHADADRVPPAAVVRALCGKLSGDQYDAAIALLTRSDVLRADNNAGAAIRIRLLATPIRIRRELGDTPFARERELLRRLWRNRAPNSYDAFEIPLAELGCASPRAAASLLESLRARQFVDVQPLDGGLRLTRPGRPLETLIDWASLVRRRAHELTRLDAMEAYARTRTCRRAFVLRYFGDVRASPRCTGCDNCLGRRRGTVWRWRH